MSKGLEALERYVENAWFDEDSEYYLTAEHLDDYHIIKKELKEYREIKEIAKQYDWENITKEIFNVNADKKYRDLFNSAIVNIQNDYRKARALEIIKEKRVDVARLLVSNSLEQYNNFDKRDILIILTQEEYDLLKEVLL